MGWLALAANDVLFDFLGRNGIQAQKHLQELGILTETQLTQFFTAATTMMETVKVKTKLRLAVAEGQDACDVITEIQKGVLESQGIDGDFGLDFLANLREHYGNNSKIMGDFYRFVARAELALDEAELSPEEFQKKRMWLRHAQEEYKAACKGESLLLSSNWAAYLQQGPVTFT